MTPPPYQFACFALFVGYCHQNHRLSADRRYNGGMRKGWICLLFLSVLLSSAVVVAQKWQQVGMLEADAEQQESVVSVDDASAIVVDRAILIESRDGKIKDTYEVLHVYGHAVLLTERLRHDFTSGSRLYQ